MKVVSLRPFGTGGTLVISSVFLFGDFGEIGDLGEISFESLKVYKVGKFESGGRLLWGCWFAFWWFCSDGVAGRQWKCLQGIACGLGKHLHWDFFLMAGRAYPAPTRTLRCGGGLACGNLT